MNTRAYNDTFRATTGSPWIQCSDRLPRREDANEEGSVLCIGSGSGIIQEGDSVRTMDGSYRMCDQEEFGLPNKYPIYRPIPKDSHQQDERASGIASHSGIADPDTGSPAGEHWLEEITKESLQPFIGKPIEIEWRRDVDADWPTFFLNGCTEHNVSLTGMNNLEGDKHDGDTIHSKMKDIHSIRLRPKQPTTEGGEHDTGQPMRVSDGNRSEAYLDINSLRKELEEARRWNDQHTAEIGIRKNCALSLSNEINSLRAQLAEQKSPWIACSERMPTKEDGDTDGKVITRYFDHGYGWEMWDQCGKHYGGKAQLWMTPPPLPAPEQDAAEKAFEKSGWKNEPSSVILFKAGYNAALSSQGKEKA